jgi:hypothetical protein
MNSADRETGLLLKLHRRHEGLYRRIAGKLRLDPSYVSRVASGDRESEVVLNALLEELKDIHREHSRLSAR